MIIIDDENHDYDSGIHPDVTKMDFRKVDLEAFLEDDRFPNLQNLYVCNAQMLCLNLCHSSLQVLKCQSGIIKTLVPDCPSLRILWCHGNSLTRMELKCPLLKTLHCFNNNLTELKLVQPCLENLHCWGRTITRLELDCPSLQVLDCSGAMSPPHTSLTDLNGLEYCSELRYLICSRSLEASANLLQFHLPNLRIELRN